jgi:hypothetical protein
MDAIFQLRDTKPMLTLRVGRMRAPFRMSTKIVAVSPTTDTGLLIASAPRVDVTVDDNTVADTASARSGPIESAVQALNAHPSAKASTGE